VAGLKIDSLLGGDELAPNLVSPLRNSLGRRTGLVLVVLVDATLCDGPSLFAQLFIASDSS
jgi:hypothetical protein